MSRMLVVLCCAVILYTSTAAQASDAKEVNIYSARQEKLIKPLLDAFTAWSGIKVNLVTGKADALLARLKTEGANTPADLFLTVDVGRLHQAKTAGLLQAVRSKFLNNRIPAQFRDPDNQWFGLSLRARVIMVSGNIDNKNAPKSYTQLADPEWRGKICVRSSSNIYNQSLVASMIHNYGRESTLQWAKGLVANFARKPTGGDRDQILAVGGGLCDVAISNTYYLALMLHSNDEAHREAAKKIRIIWPDQDGRGAHVNISGAGVTATARNAVNAVKLLEFLVSEQAQRWYAKANYEFPMLELVDADETLRSWGDFKRDDAALTSIGNLNTQAVILMDQANWK